VVLTLFVLVGCASTASIPASEVREHKSIHHGMTMEQVRANWGEPLRVIKGDHNNFDETWIYKPHWKIRIDLDFKDGILVRGLRE
jgi:uncharacterized protein YcfL